MLLLLKSSIAFLLLTHPAHELSRRQPALRCATDSDVASSTQTVQLRSFKGSLLFFRAQYLF